jgi:hemoglobin-like flavoprotein
MPLDLQALETSFDLVASDSDALMDGFYARLFTTAPEVKPLFAAMAHVVGEAWRPEYEHAWAAAFDVVATAMLEGASASPLDLAA